MTEEDAKSTDEDQRYLEMLDMLAESDRKILTLLNEITKKTMILTLTIKIRLIAILVHNTLMKFRIVFFVISAVSSSCSSSN